MKQKTIDKLTRIGTWCSVFLCIIIAYMMGQFNGVIEGMAAVQQENNETLCDFMHEWNSSIYTDPEGYCVIAEKTYDIKMHCPYQDFRVKGNQSLDWQHKLKVRMDSILYYPLLHCWGPA